MIRVVNITVLLCFGIIAFAQDNYPKISFELGYNNQFVEMNKFNRFFIDSNFTKYSGINSPFRNTHNFNFAFKIRPRPIVDFGLSLEFQKGFKVGRPMLKTLDENLDLVFTEGYRKLSLKSYNFGIATTLYINRFFEFQNETNILNRFDFGIDLLFGYCLSIVTNEVHNTTVDPIYISEAEWFANDFHSKIGISVEYLLFSKTIFCSIGLRSGYQFLRTNTMVDRLDNYYVKMPYSEPINLDLSGIYYGIYLKFGK